MHPSVQAFSVKKLARLRWASKLVELHTHQSDSKRHGRVAFSNSRASHTADPEPIRGSGGEGGGDAEDDDFEGNEDERGRLYGTRWRIRGPRIVPESLVVPRRQTKITDTAAHLSWVAYERDRCREWLRTAAEELASSELLPTRGEPGNRDAQHQSAASPPKASSPVPPHRLMFRRRPTEEATSMLGYLRQLEADAKCEVEVRGSTPSQTTKSQDKQLPLAIEFYNPPNPSERSKSAAATLSEVAAAVAAEATGATRVRPKTAPRLKGSDVITHPVQGDQSEAQVTEQKRETSSGGFKSSLFSSTALVNEPGSKPRPSSALPYLSSGGSTNNTYDNSTLPHNQSISPTGASSSASQALRARRPSVITMVMPEKLGQQLRTGGTETDTEGHFAEVEAYLKVAEKDTTIAMIAQSRQDEPNHDVEIVSLNQSAHQLAHHVVPVSALMASSLPASRPTSASAAAAHAKANLSWFRTLLPRPKSAVVNSAADNSDSKLITGPPCKIVANASGAVSACSSGGTAKPAIRPASSTYVRKVNSTSSGSRQPNRPRSAYPAGTNLPTLPATVPVSRPMSATLKPHTEIAKAENVHSMETSVWTRRHSAGSQNKKRVAWKDDPATWEGTKVGNDGAQSDLAETLDGTNVERIHEDDDELDAWEDHFDRVAEITTRTSSGSRLARPQGGKVETTTPTTPTTPLPAETWEFVNSLQQRNHTSAVGLNTQSHSISSSNQQDGNAGGLSPSELSGTPIRREGRNSRVLGKDQGLTLQGDVPLNGTADEVASFVATHVSSTNEFASPVQSDWAKTHNRVLHETISKLDEELNSLFGF